MPLSIYRHHERRRVLVAPGFKDEVLASIRALSTDCRENVLLLEDELKRLDPEVEFRCGALDGRVDVFAMEIPDCRGHRLVVSIDHRDAPSPPAHLHGVVPTEAACANAQRLASRHRRLEMAVWEGAE